MAKKKITKKMNDFLKVYEKKGLNISSACKAVKISRWTYYEWRKNNSEFDSACLETEEGFKDWATSTLVAKMQEGDNTAIIFYHKTKMKDRGFIERHEIENSGTIKTEGSLSLAMSDEEKKALLEKFGDNKK